MASGNACFTASYGKPKTNHAKTAIGTNAAKNKTELSLAIAYQWRLFCRIIFSPSRSSIIKSYFKNKAKEIAMANIKKTETEK